MEEKKKYYRSKVGVVTAKFLSSLITEINEFCKDKFVVGIQYPEFLQQPELTAIISYKVQEGEED